MRTISTRMRLISPARGMRTAYWRYDVVVDKDMFVKLLGSLSEPGRIEVHPYPLMPLAVKSLPVVRYLTSWCGQFIMEREWMAKYGLYYPGQKV